MTDFLTRLPNELQNIITMFTWDYEDIIAYCIVNKSASEVCTDNAFWKAKVRVEYGPVAVELYKLVGVKGKNPSLRYKAFIDLSYGDIVTNPRYTFIINDKQYWNSKYKLEYGRDLPIRWPDKYTIAGNYLVYSTRFDDNVDIGSETIIQDEQEFIRRAIEKRRLKVLKYAVESLKMKIRYVDVKLSKKLKYDNITTYLLKILARQTDDLYTLKHILEDQIKLKQGTRYTVKALIKASIEERDEEYLMKLLDKYIFGSEYLSLLAEYAVNNGTVSFNEYMQDKYPNFMQEAEINSAEDEDTFL